MKAHRHVYHSALGSRVIKKERRGETWLKEKKVCDIAPSWWCGSTSHPKRFSRVEMVVQ